MRIVFMGTPDFAVGALEAILQAGHQVAAVVTQPDKPKGRGKEIQVPPVKAFAMAHGIPVFQFRRVLFRSKPFADITPIFLWWPRLDSCCRKRSCRCRNMAV